MSQQRVVVVGWKGFLGGLRGGGERSVGAVLWGGGVGARGIGWAGRCLVVGWVVCMYGLDLIGLIERNGGSKQAFNGSIRVL